MCKGTESFNNATEIICDGLRESIQRIPDGKKRTVQEVRLRTGKPVAFSDGRDVYFTDKNGSICYSPSERTICATQKNIYDTYRRLCSYSVYTHRDEIKNGYITVRGGHRVGLCGTAKNENGIISAVDHISSLNIRIARQIIGAADGLISKIAPIDGGVLIAGKPSDGKTTLLRDLARSVSIGRGCKMMRISLIDERGELSGTYSGIAGCDVGLCDVFNGYSKKDGIISALRSMSPNVIAVDEIGDDSDADSVIAGLNAGVLFFATIHAGSIDELLRRRQSKKLLDTGAFKYVVILRSLRTEEIITL